MRPDSGESVLDGALRELLDAWMATSDGWRDQARSEVDREFIDPISNRSKQAACAMSELSQLCRDAVRRCQ